MSTKADNLVKISQVLAEIFGGICRFLLPHPKGYSFSLRSMGLLDLLDKYAQNVAQILPFIIYSLELQYSNSFRNGNVLPISPKIGCHDNVPYRIGKTGQD